MDETLKLAYTKALQSTLNQLDAIFTLQAQNEILTMRVAELEKELEAERSFTTKNKTNNK